MKLKENSEMEEMIPLKFFLSQNYPNPFKEKTTIKYCLAYQSRVQLIVFNSDNEKVETLVDEIKEPGTYEVEFRVSSRLRGGIYSYRLEAGEFTQTKKMILLK
jgi:hypothetical protein